MSDHTAVIEGFVTALCNGSFFEMLALFKQKNLKQSSMTNKKYRTGGNYQQNESVLVREL